MVSSAIGSIVAGLVLLFYVSTVDTSMAPSHLGSLFILIGAILGFVSLLIAMSVVVPTVRHLAGELKLVDIASNSNSGAAKSSSSDSKSQQSLQRLKRNASAMTSALWLALILMLVGGNI